MNILPVFLFLCLLVAFSLFSLAHRASIRWLGKWALICSLLLSTTPPLWGEKEQVAYNAKRLKSSYMHGKRCKKLKGNVKITFQQSGIVLTAHKAYKYEQEDLVEAYGKVTMTDKNGSNIQADYLSYRSDQQLANLEGNIHCQMGEYQFKTAKMVYHVATKQGQFYGGGELCQENIKLTSQTGAYDGIKHTIHCVQDVLLKNGPSTLECPDLLYHTETEKATFKGATKIRSEGNLLTTQIGGRYTLPTKHLLFNHGTLHREDLVLSADQLELLDQDECKATGHVAVWAKAHDATIKGDAAQYTKKEERLEISGNPLLTKIVNNEKIHLRADQFIAQQKNEKDEGPIQEIQALGHVKIYSSQLQGVADGALYHSKKQDIKLTGEPIFWCGGYQITGKEVSLSVQERDTMKLYIHKDLFMAAPDPVGNYNQIKGQKMVAQFQGSSIEKIEIQGGGHSLYFILDEHQELVGMNEIECMNIALNMANQILEWVKFESQPKGTFYPADQLKEEQMRLKGFSWHIEQRPSQPIVDSIEQQKHDDDQK